MSWRMLDEAAGRMATRLISGRAPMVLSVRPVPGHILTV